MRYTYHKPLWHIAKDIASARTILNEKNRANNPKFDRGEKNDDVEILGVMGELIVLDYLLTNTNRKFKMTNLVNRYGSKDPDFVIDNKRIDVKANKHSDFLNVSMNKDAHKRGLGIIDLYWFVYILNKEECDFYFVDYDEVSKWDYKFMKYSDAFYCNIQNLKK
jgi:hypothetical protein